MTGFGSSSSFDPPEGVPELERGSGLFESGRAGFSVRSCRVAKKTAGFRRTRECGGGECERAARGGR